ncbi:MAG TPA: metallophosphoesterase, partial [Pyrinomonadaceae bacterium]|nr:metallophosphoesterase [Pyrinomonadaceae bacterium]
MEKFHQLPAPTGGVPFHLDLAEVLDDAAIQAITNAKKLVFHIAGDMGGIADAIPQRLVTDHMERDFTHDPAHPEDDPAFFYGLGDCVYFHGETSEYFAQFYLPYEHYLAPIFAIPGNHDGDNIAIEASLGAFIRNFCAPEPVITPEAGNTHRHVMTQPNVYWTLITPLATIVGLYSNVPEQGRITQPQRDWLAG